MVNSQYQGVTKFYSGTEYWPSLVQVAVSSETKVSTIQVLFRISFGYSPLNWGL